VQWLAGDSARQTELLHAIARLERDDGVVWLRRRVQRRRLARIPLADGRSFFAKHYLASDRHAWRDAWKQRLRLATAQREWRTLTRLRAARLPVPAPLALTRLPSGEHVLVTEWIDGAPLAEALADAAQRRPLLAAVGALVRALHEAGWVHRDLHRENILIANGAPVLIDLQAARRSRSAAARLRDLGRLDHSLRRLLARGDRVRLRAAALGVALPLRDADREPVRAVGRASLARARAHAQSRARRSLRAGRRAQPFASGGGRGLVSRAFDPAAVVALLASPADTVGFEVRRYRACPRDLWRGSAARRAWAIAHALEASDLDAVMPVAFLEWSLAGLPLRSALVVGVDDEKEPVSPARRVEAQVDLLARLHEAGFATPGLDASGIALAERDGRVAARVHALEALRFPAHTSDAERRAALARLEAEWQRQGVPEPLRARARAHYRRRLPIERR
jgi:tRNA A-37 threonylcarbamoyl transferase component Bud32